MFTTEELRLIDDYFTLLFYNAFCVTIRSKCTGHEWHIIVREGTHFRSFEILHQHNNHDEFHIHGHAGSFKKVLQAIKSHDAFQLNGRKKISVKAFLNILESQLSHFNASLSFISQRHIPYTHTHQEPVHRKLPKSP